MISRRRAAQVGLLAAMVSTACRLGGELCDTSIPPAIEVVILDAVTNAPRAEDAVGIVQAGTFVDTLRPARSDGTHLLSRATTQTGPGTYDVLITHEGYEPWSLANVRVGTGRCGMETHALTAELQPASTP
jgi:hypothetical protein